MDGKFVEFDWYDWRNPMAGLVWINLEAEPMSDLVAVTPTSLEVDCKVGQIVHTLEFDPNTGQPSRGLLVRQLRT